MGEREGPRISKGDVQHGLDLHRLHVVNVAQVPKLKFLDILPIIVLASSHLSPRFAVQTHWGQLHDTRIGKAFHGAPRHTSNAPH